MNEHHSRAALGPLVSLLALGACATAPLSFVEGGPLTRADPTLYPVRVVSVDGSIEFSGPGKPIQLSPGTRWMVFEAVPGEGARGPVQKSFVFKVEPCTHYFFAAKRNSPMEADWSLVVDKKEPVLGCIPEEELRRAGLSAAGSSTSAAK